MEGSVLEGVLLFLVGVQVRRDCEEGEEGDEGEEEEG